MGGREDGSGILDGSRNELGSAWSHGVVLIVPGGGIRVGDGRHHALPMIRQSIPTFDKDANRNRKRRRAPCLFSKQPGGGGILFSLVHGDADPITEHGCRVRQ